MISNSIIPVFSLETVTKLVVFNHPSDITTDAKGFVYVADTNNHRILKLTTNGAYVTEWGEKGEKPGEFIFPGGVAVDSNGNVYVLDGGNGRIQKFTNGGTFIKSWKLVQPEPVTGESYLPNDIAIDSKGFVYVTVDLKPSNPNWSIKEGRIQKYTISGTFVAIWQPPHDVYQLFQSEGITINRHCIIQMCYDDSVFVTDRGDDRIRIFSKNGALLKAWGSTGDGKGQFESPSAIEILDANILVADTGNDRIQKLSADGNFISEWGEKGDGKGQFNVPIALSINSKGQVLVVDMYNNRIQVFELTDGTCSRGAQQIKSGVCFITEWG
jgi:DNA-binding beta-propeller fold protein YncE